MYEIIFQITTKHSNKSKKIKKFEESISGTKL